MEEKREFIRQDLNVKVDLKKIIETSIVLGEFSDVSKNISAGGLCLVVSEKLKIGDKLQIGMELPSKKINAKGRVIWISELEINGRGYEEVYNLGVEFTEICDEDREEINKLVLEYLHAKEED